MVGSYEMNFNQDFTSISVLNKNGFRLFSIRSANKCDEIFTAENLGSVRIVERLFNSSLVVLVTYAKPKCLKMLHFKKQQDICNCVYPTEVLSVRMNRYRLVVCLAESIYIHDIRDMKILHSIENIALNESGLCTLALNSLLAYPICTAAGELQIYNSYKLKYGQKITAHESQLSAISFSSNGSILATASERGTVIRVFCAKNAQKVQEFRRGVKRCVRIASLIFSTNGDFLCASSNTETVHIFKIDPKAVEAAQGKAIIHSSDAIEKTAAINPANSLTSSTITRTVATTASWSVSSYLSKAMSPYWLPSQIGDVFRQDRAFGTAVLSQANFGHVCGLTRLQKQQHLLIACNDGFLYIYDFNTEKGGLCKLLQVHDLRCGLEDVIELSDTESIISTNSLNSNELLTNKTEEGQLNYLAAANVIIENPKVAPDNSYASIVKGVHNVTTLTDSVQFRKLCDAIDTPTKLYDETEFPPVTIARKE